MRKSLINKHCYLCPNFVRNAPDLNTVQSISRLNNFITHMSWSQYITVGVIKVYMHILVFNKCMQCTYDCIWLNI